MAEQFSGRLFGTDGIRGRFGEAPLTEEYVQGVGRAMVRWLQESRRKGAREPFEVVVAGDTRESTPELASWLIEGFKAESPEVVIRHTGLADPSKCSKDSVASNDRSRDTTDTLNHPGACGVLPTPAVALLTRLLGADLGVSLSASHNPFHDNGIKFFDSQGLKFDDDAELEIEERIYSVLAEDEQHRSAEGGPAVHANSSMPDPDPSLADRYLDALADAFAASKAKPLAGLEVVLDTGNGAASALAKPLFERLGAEVTLLFADPDGRNINDNCGSISPEQAAEAVKKQGAHLGFAFDGDADRVIVVDEQGQIRDGDEVLYLWATHLQRQGALPRSAIVATSMSNLGLERALAEERVEVHRCDVGDRAVVQMLRERSLRLGGEQSGHLVDLERSTTGDGLLTALAIAEIVQAESGQANEAERENRAEARPLSQLLNTFQAFPQRLVNVPVKSKPPFDSIPELAQAANKVEQELGNNGRLVLRYSGTEPLARVMIEAQDHDTVERLCHELAELIRVTLG